MKPAPPHRNAFVVGIVLLGSATSGFSSRGLVRPDPLSSDSSTARHAGFLSRRTRKGHDDCTVMQATAGTGGPRRQGWLLCDEPLRQGKDPPLGAGTEPGRRRAGCSARRQAHSPLPPTARVMHRAAQSTPSSPGRGPVSSVSASPRSFATDVRPPTSTGQRLQRFQRLAKRPSATVRPAGLSSRAIPR
jgi:hypothetical protein